MSHFDEEPFDRYIAVTRKGMNHNPYGGFYVDLGDAQAEVDRLNERDETSPWVVLHLRYALVQWGTVEKG